MVTIPGEKTESVLSGIEAGSSCKSLHIGPILWQQGITLIPRMKFYPSQWLSGKNTAGMLVCSEGPGFDPRPRQSMSILMLFRASPGCDTLTSQEPWHVPVTQLIGGAPLVFICSFRPNPYHHFKPKERNNKQKQSYAYNSTFNIVSAGIWLLIF